jgi:hypothetical protein
MTSPKLESISRRCPRLDKESYFADLIWRSHVPSASGIAIQPVCWHYILQSQTPLALLDGFCRVLDNGKDYL